MGMGPVHVSYMRFMGEVGATTWEMPVGFTGSGDIIGTSGISVP